MLYKIHLLWTCWSLMWIVWPIVLFLNTGGLSVWWLDPKTFCSFSLLTILLLFAPPLSISLNCCCMGHIAIQKSLDVDDLTKFVYFWVTPVRVLAKMVVWIIVLTLFELVDCIFIGLLFSFCAVDDSNVWCWCFNLHLTWVFWRCNNFEFAMVIGRITFLSEYLFLLLETIWNFFCAMLV